MLRTFVIFMGLALMLGCGVAIAAWPQSQSEQTTRFNEQQLKAGYARIRAGITPESQLDGLGFYTADATKLSYLDVVETFMPGDSFSFDNLDPAVRACLEARDRCIGYIFAAPNRPDARVTLLIEGGRVTFKAIAGVTGIASGKPGVRAAVD